MTLYLYVLLSAISRSWSFGIRALTFPSRSRPRQGASTSVSFPLFTLHARSSLPLLAFTSFHDLTVSHNLPSLARDAKTMDYYNAARAGNTVSSSLRQVQAASKEAYDSMPAFNPPPAMSSAIERAGTEATAGWTRLRAAVWGEEEQAQSGGGRRPATPQRQGSATSASTINAGATTSKTVTGDGETRWGRLVAVVNDASAKVSKAVNRDGGYGAFRLASCR